MHKHTSPVGCSFATLVLRVGTMSAWGQDRPTASALDPGLLVILLVCRGRYGVSKSNARADLKTQPNARVRTTTGWSSFFTEFALTEIEKPAKQCLTGQFRVHFARM